MPTASHFRNSSHPRLVFQHPGLIVPQFPDASLLNQFVGTALVGFDIRKPGKLIHITSMRGRNAPYCGLRV